MDQVYLPGKIRDRIQDLMKSRKVMQAELAAKIGCSESALSRFISGKTDNLGDESIIRRRYIGRGMAVYDLSNFLKRNLSVILIQTFIDVSTNLCRQPSLLRGVFCKDIFSVA